MKKTFKKNILKNNKYNFKTELLLSALALLVGFGTTACKKDNVKPKKNNTENPINPVKPVDPVNPPVVPPKSSEQLKKERLDNLKSLVRRIIKDSIKDNKKTGVELKHIFLINAFGGLEYPSFEDTLNGTNRRIPTGMTVEEFRKKYSGNNDVGEEYYGVIKSAVDILKDNEEANVLEKQEIELLNKLKDSSIMYLNLKGLPVKSK